MIALVNLPLEDDPTIQRQIQKARVHWFDHVNPLLCSQVDHQASSGKVGLPSSLSQEQTFIENYFQRRSTTPVSISGRKRRVLGRSPGEVLHVCVHDNEGTCVPVQLCASLMCLACFLSQNGALWHRGIRSSRLTALVTGSIHYWFGV